MCFSNQKEVRAVAIELPPLSVLGPYSRSDGKGCGRHRCEVDALHEPDMRLVPRSDENTHKVAGLTNIGSEKAQGHGLFGLGPRKPGALSAPYTPSGPHIPSTPPTPSTSPSVLNHPQEYDAEDARKVSGGAMVAINS